MTCRLWCGSRIQLQESGAVVPPWFKESIPFACPCPVPIQALHRALYLGRYSILLSHWAIPPISAGVQLGDIHNDSNACHIRAPESWVYGELFVLHQRDHHHHHHHHHHHNNNNNNNNNHSDSDNGNDNHKDNDNDNDKKNKNTTPVTKTSMSAFKPTVAEALLLHQGWGPFNWLHSTLDGRWWLCKKICVLDTSSRTFVEGWGSLCWPVYLFRSTLSQLQLMLNHLAQCSFLHRLADLPALALLVGSEAQIESRTSSGLALQCLENVKFFSLSTALCHTLPSWHLFAGAVLRQSSHGFASPSIGAKLRLQHLTAAPH